MVLRLYVAGDAPNSARARANLRRLLADVREDAYRLEIIDCLVEPLRALDDGVLVTPTLVRIEPKPQRTVVGSLNAIDRVADALEIEAMTVSQASGASNE
jgi:circadian clock protein KaiB